MDPLLRAIYAAAGELARAAAVVAPAGDSKLLRSLAARRGIRDRYRRWGRRYRDDARPLLWMHAPSVGEGLQARPVIEVARAERPALQIAYTHFSPSAERFAASLDADFADYLPFDTPGDARVALDSLRPDALVFSKLDVWPALVEEATRRGVPLGLVSGTLAPGSTRATGFAARALRRTYASLDAVGAIAEEDAARLVELGVRRDAVTVTGDARYDQVWARAWATDRDGALLRSVSSTRPTLVAGSTWPADERELLPAFQALRTRLHDARMVIAPHEPTLEHLAPIEQWSAASGFSLARLGTSDATTADVVLVDRVGVLGELYALADVAYVGGGFHDAGLHSVLEPAAFGAPVLFGPRHANSREAGLLLRAGGGAEVASAGEAAERLAEWLGSPAARQDAGGRARALVERGLGAARRSFALVAGLLDAGRAAAPNERR